MRKALISLIMAATAMTPVAAWAQDEDGGRAERIRERNEQRQEARSENRQAQSEQRQQVRSERQEARTDRQEARTERRVERTEVRQQRFEPANQEAVVGAGTRAFNRRGERNLERARDAGTVGADQTGEQWRQNRRDNRQDWRNERGENRQDWRNGRRDDRQDRVNDGRQNRQDWQQGRSNDGRNWRQDRGGDRRDWRSSWNRSGWRNDNRYNWQHWRSVNRHAYRLSPYYSPYRNHHYSRFSIGVFLEPLFYGRNFWIGDPYYYRLPPAPPGTQWVRYYNDVLLVDTWSGEVIDVIYDFFW